jgi:hypothetical protein
MGERFSGTVDIDATEMGDLAAENPAKQQELAPPRDRYVYCTDAPDSRARPSQ